MVSIMAVIMCDKPKLKYGFFANLRGPMSLGRKLRMVAGNTATKVRKMQGCCGNYDQPGC